MRRTRLCLTVVGLLGALTALRAAPPAAPAPAADDEKLLRAAKIAVDGPGLLDYFRQRTTTPAQQDHIQALIRQLGDDAFKVRHKATTELAALGPVAVPFLRRSLNDPDEELKERAETLIATADGLETRAGQSAAAARLLRQRAPADAAAVLLAFAPDAETAEVEDEMLTDLALLAVHDGKVDAPLVAALKDKHAARRDAAGVVMGRSGTAEQRGAVQPLLADPDPRVRFRAAQGLLAGRDAAAVPALIALMKDGPADLAYRSAELLSCAFGEHGPRVPFGDDAATRQYCVKAWTAWAQKHGRSLDLTRAEVDLPAFNPALRARDVARQFFNALVAGDLNAFKKAAAAPFHIVGGNTYKNPDDLNNLFNENPLGLRNAQLTASVMGAVPLGEYFKNVAAPDTDFMRPYYFRPPRRPDVVMLLVQQIPIGAPASTPDPSQGHLFVVRLTGDQPHVIAVSPGRTNLPTDW